jgi:hypothetical protein
VRAGLAAATLACLAVAGAAATDLDLDTRRSPATDPPACTSPVVRRCAPVGAGTAAGAPPSVELLRPGAGADPLRLLETIVIEGERLGRPAPSVRSALDAATAVPSARSFESGEGGVCTCVTPCPPWPLACCTCTKGGRDARIDNLLRH